MPTKLIPWYTTRPTIPIHRGDHSARLNGALSAWEPLPLALTYAPAGYISTVPATITGPTNGIEYALTTGSGLPLEFITNPVDRDFTLSGSVTCQMYGNESNMSANATFQMQVFRLGADGTFTQIFKSAQTSEMSTTNGPQSWTVTPTSTAMKKGDRIVLRMFYDDVGATAMAAGYTTSLFYSPTSGAGIGDTFITFAETFDVLPYSSPSGTQLCLTDAAGPAVGAASEKLLSLARGSSVVTATTISSPAGPTAPIQLGNPTVLEWYSNPLNAFSLSGLIQANIRIKSSVSNNTSVMTEIAICNGDGSSPVVWGIGRPINKILNTESSNAISIAGPDVNVTQGQRIRVRVFVDDGYDTLLNAGTTYTLYFNGGSGATGDSFITLPQTITESATPLAMGRRAAATTVRGLSISNLLEPTYTDLIDDFNRADGSVLAGAGAAIWAPNALQTTGQEALISGNQLAVPRNWDHLLTKDYHGANADLTVECVNPGTGAVAFTMCALETGANTCDAIAAEWNSSNGWYWNQATNGGWNGTDLTAGPGPAAGDTFWLSKRAHIFTLYRKPAGGVYTQVFTSKALGALASTQGQMGIAVRDTTARWDNFRGGPKVLPIGRIANPYLTDRTSWISNINFGWTSTHAIAQGFKAKTSKLDEVKVLMRKLGTPTVDAIVEIQGSIAGKPDGVVVATCGTVPFASLTDSNVYFTFPVAATLTPGLDYFIVLRSPSPYNAINNYPMTGGLTGVLLEGYGYCTTGSGTDVWGAQGANSLTMTLKFGGQVKGVTPYVPPPITAPIGAVKPTNLITNTGLETDLVGWTSNATGTLTRDTTRARTGVASAKFVSTQAIFYPGTDGIGISGNTIGRRYTAVGWFYGEGAAIGKNFTFLLREYFPGGAGYEDSYLEFTIKAGWQQLVVSRTLTHNDSTGLQVFYYSYVGSNPIDVGVPIWFDDTQVTENAPAIVHGLSTSGSGAAPISVGKVTSSLPLLDDFNRANGAIGANWSGGVVGVGGIVINGNQADSSSLGSGTVPGAAFYTAASFPTNHEASAIALGPNASGFSGVLVGGDGSAGGYLCGWQGGSWMVLRHDGGGFTNIGASWVGPCVAGDIVGGRILGNQVQVLKNGVVVVSTVDTTYRGTKAGAYCGAWGNRLDDFRAGVPVNVVYGITLAPVGTAPVSIGKASAYAVAKGVNVTPAPVSVPIGRISAAPITYSGAILADNPRGYWRLSDTGTFATDITGHGLDGVYYGANKGQPSLLPAETDGCVGVTGVSTSRVEIPADATINGLVSGYTVEAWVNIDALAGVGQKIISKSNAGATTGFSLGLGTNNCFKFTSYAVKDYQFTYALTAGVTYHVAVVLRANFTADLYVNGVLRQSLTHTTGSLTGTGPIWFGRWQPASEYFAGRIDEAAIYTNELTAGQILSHYNAGISGLPGGTRVRGVGVTGAGTAPVAIGKAATVFTPLSTLISQDGPYRQYAAATWHATADTDGTSTGQGPTTADHLANGPWTFECDMKCGAADLGAVRVLLAAYGWGAIMKGADNKIRLHIDSSESVVAESSVAISDTNWHKVAVTRNGTAVVIMIDGVDVTTLVNTANTNPDTGYWSTIGGDWENHGKAGICVSHGGAGRIANVAIFKSVVSPARLAVHAATKPQVTGVTLVAAGTAPISIGRKVAATPVRGVTLVPGPVSVPIGRIAGAPTFPAISGLAIRLDASSLGLANGADVSSWPGLGGGPSGAISGSPNPKYATGVLNGLPVVRFTAAEGRVRIAGSSAVTAQTIAYVARQRGPGFQRVVTADMAYGNALYGFWNQFEDAFYDNGWGVPDAKVAATTAWKMYSNDATAGGVSRLFNNGNLISTVAGGAVGLGGTLAISGHDATTGESSDCDVAEVVVFNRVLSDAERQQVEAYLRAKWMVAPTGGSAVRGITLIEQLSIPVDVGRKISTTTVRGISVAPVGAVPVPVGMVQPKGLTHQDNFNRANGAVGSDWTTVLQNVFGGGVSPTIISNEFTASADFARRTSNPYKDNARVRTTFRFATKTNAAPWIGFLNAAGSGYFVELAADEFSICWVEGTSYNTINVSSVFSYTSGAEIAFEIQGTTLRALYRATPGVGAWTTVNTQTIPGGRTYAGPWYPFLGAADTTNGNSRQDDFVAETLTPSVFGVTLVGAGAAPVTIGKRAAASTARGISGLVVSGTAPLPVGRKISATTVRGIGATTGIVAPIGKVTGGVATYKSVILADSPLSYWRLNETAGAMTDEKGLNNGTVLGASARGVTGLLTGDTDKAFQMDGGTGQGVTIGNQAAYQIGNLTLEAWIKTSVTDGTYRTIIGKQFAYGVFIRDGLLTIYEWPAAATIQSASVADGVRHHVAVVFQEGVAGGSRAYVDGVAVGSPFTHTTADHTTGLCIGTNAGPAQEFSGVLDDAVIYNSALSPAQIAAHYAAGISGATGGGTTVRGATLAPAGVAPVAVGKKISATVVKGVTAVATGAAPVPIGKRAAVTTARGITPSGVGVALLPVGRKISATTVRGMGAATGIVAPVGKRGGATAVRGISLTGVGVVPVAIGKRISATTTKGITVAPGGAPIPTGRVTATSVTRGITFVAGGTVPVPVGKRTATTTARGVTIIPGVVPISIGKRTPTTTVYGLTGKVQRQDVNLPATFSLAATMTSRKVYARPLAANLSLPATQTLKRYAPRTLNASLPLTATLSRRVWSPRTLTTGLTLLPALAKRTKVFRRLDSTLNFTATLDKKRAIDFSTQLNFDLYMQAGKKIIPIRLASTLALIAEIKVKKQSYSDILLGGFLGVAKLLNAKSSGVRLLLATMGKANLTSADEDDGHLDSADASLGESTLHSVE